MNANNTKTWDLYIQRLAAKTGKNAAELNRTEGQRILAKLQADRSERLAIALERLY